MDVTTTNHFIQLVPRQGGGTSNAATEQPREDGGLAQTDGDKWSTVAHQQSVSRGSLPKDTTAVTM